MSYIRRHKWDILIWGLALIFTGLYISLIFNINLSTDEIFTVELMGENMRGIVEGTAADVHPPLYYFYGAVFDHFSHRNIQLLKIASIIPFVGLFIYMATVVRRHFGDAAAFFSLLFFTCVPCTMEYSVQIRMYSSCAVFVGICGVSAYIVYKENRISDWVIMTLAAVISAYLHYFALVSVGFEMLALLIALICERKKESVGPDRIKRWIISVVVMIVSYIPWLPVFIRQFTRVKTGFWIPEFGEHFIWEIFIWIFDLETYPGFVYLYIALLVLTGVFGVIWLKKKKSRELTFALACLIVPIMMTTTGVVITLVRSPIFVPRYEINIMMLLSLWWGITFAGIVFDEKEKRKVLRIVATVLASVMLIFSGVIQYTECYKQEYVGQYTEQTIAFFRKYFTVDDYVLFNYQDMEFVYRYYFPADKLYYVRDFDLDSDYRYLWFMCTANEWPITELDCIEHNLDMRPLGTYGFEGNEFTLYRVEHK